MKVKKEPQKSRTYYILESLAVAIEQEAANQDLSASQLVRKVMSKYLKEKNNNE